MFTVRCVLIVPVGEDVGRTLRPRCGAEEGERSTAVSS